ncbi:MAG: helix-turn-helix domain-containing protein [Desulfobacteraceae bacterium]|nr:helix-turn-helix domain-containing protein [Desulfobacteraceae bacterium]
MFNTTILSVLIFLFYDALYEFERNQAALAAVGGNNIGRKPKLSPDQVQALVQLYDCGQFTIKEICKVMDISKTTLYEYLRKARGALIEAAPSVGQAARPVQQSINSGASGIAT